MGVHDLASYVKYHQQKLRDEQAKAEAASRPQKKGVDSLYSKDQYTEVIKKGNIVFLDAFATWCGPCKAIAPTISEWSNHPDYEGKVDFYKFDVDQVNELAHELGVRAMPSFFVFDKEGNLAKTIVGANPKAVKAALDEVIAASA